MDGGRDLPRLPLAPSGSVAQAAGAALILMIGTGLTTTPQSALEAEMFPTSVRYSGHAVATNLGNALFGSIVALISGILVSATGSPVAPAFYIRAVSLFAFVVVLRTPETWDFDLRHSHTEPSAELPDECQSMGPAAS